MRFRTHDAEAGRPAELTAAEESQLENILFPPDPEPFDPPTPSAYREAQGIHDPGYER